MNKYSLLDSLHIYIIHFLFPPLAHAIFILGVINNYNAILRYIRRLSSLKNDLLKNSREKFAARVCGAFAHGTSKKHEKSRLFYPAPSSCPL